MLKFMIMKFIFKIPYMALKLFDHSISQRLPAIKGRRYQDPGCY